ncbi:lipocalin family protein [Persicimonas caeni]|uniref:Lipocalin family protein n=1 Tax=Persicimonas caeni TaxID=2292766 RepID=A0A4Y6PVX9_PERCE|nr:lipocalin family protein [Persicimonas caeni]QDG52403.1 lipocalin family protein [Persicimonas caeni]QED33625.1 lipocalin family protein [Persicimonas caeni]
MRLFSLCHRWIVCLLTAVVMLAAGCASSTPVTDAPLEATKQQELRQTLVGTWQHTHTEDADGQREPMNAAKITWTFNNDGTGVYHQVVPTIGMDAKNPFQWQLEGRNIRLSMETGSDATYYRADEWAAGQMKWFNYTLSDYYIVKKQ